MADAPWILDEQDRYARLRLIHWWDQERLARAQVLVVGAGALGNEVLKNLALVGIGHIRLIDFDGIESSNLTRSVLFRRRDVGRPKAEVAAEALRDLNPDIRVTAHAGNVLADLGLGHFRDADVVIGCLDNREARLWVNRCCWKVGTPWIDGGIQEVAGVVQVFVPPEGTCYECGMTELDYRLISLRYSCPQLPREDLAAGRAPTTPTIASMIGGLQVQEALKLLHGLPAAASCALVYNGNSHQFYRTELPRQEGCLSHESYGEPDRLKLTLEDSPAELLAELRQRHSLEGSLRLVLDRDLLVALHCQACGTAQPALRPVCVVDYRQLACPTCQSEMRPEIVHAIEEHSPLADQPFGTLGIPDEDILRVESTAGEHYLRLAQGGVRAG